MSGQPDARTSRSPDEDKRPNAGRYRSTGVTNACPVASAVGTVRDNKPELLELLPAAETRGPALLMSNAQLVPTPAGDARITWYWADEPRAVLALGHGASTGIEARDLRTLAATLPQRGITVALVEQPWRVAGGMGAPSTKTLDTAWRAVGPQLAKPGLPLIAGGRSAGARVACRTARELGADAVLALSFPLHAPGRPEEVWDLEELLGTGLPTLVVQGGYDPFGRPEEFPPTPSSIELVDVPFADHVFAVSTTTGSSQDAALTLITDAVTHWLERLLQPTDPPTCPD